MFNLYGFQLSVSTSTTPTYTALTPMADPIATVSGSLLYVGALNQFIGAALLGTNANKSKVVSPSILNIAPVQITPVIASALPTKNPGVVLQMASPIKLVTNEGIEVYGSNESSSAVDQQDAFLWLGDGAQAPVNGNIVTVRATFTSSTTADAWENAAITFDTVLPAGSYNIVGARGEGVHLKAFRFVFQGNASVRPGTLGALDVDGADLPGARFGGWGVWGKFDQFTPPSVDHVTDGTSETVSLYLDLVKTA